MSKWDIASETNTSVPSMVYDDPPPSYSDVCSLSGDSQCQSATNPNINGFVTADFTPDGLSTRFSDLINKANRWLSEHAQWRVKSCETVAFPSNAGIPQTDKVTFSGKTFVQCLRLWLIPRTNPLLPPSHIQFFNIVPKVTGSSGQGPIFEGTKQMLHNLNSKLQSSPLEGKIVSVESLPLPVNVAKHSDDCVEPNKVLLTETAMKVVIFRIFYIFGPVTNDVVDIMDFNPKEMQPISRHETAVRHESFADLVNQASSWCCQGNVCTIQTLIHKLDGNRAIITLRIVTLKPHPAFQSRNPFIPSLTGPLTSKTFLPVQLTAKEKFKNWNEPPQFESMQQTMIRISEWAKHHNAKIISGETKFVQMYPQPDELGPQSTDINPSNDANSIYIVRIYLDGTYSDPTIQMCPISYRGWYSKPVKEGFPVPVLPPNQDECLLM